MENMTDTGYYDVDIDIEAFMQNCGLDDMFWLKDVKLRKFYLNYDVSQEGVHDIVRHILQINAEDRGIPREERKPILLYVISNGGDVDSGFELIDVIESSVTPVITVNLGYQYSMGFLIGLAGHRRYASKNAKFLMHDGANFVYDSGSKAQDRMDFNKRVESRIREYVLSHSRITPEEYDGNLRVEWYMFADEAKEKGVTDFIIGEDCPLDEVI